MSDLKEFGAKIRERRIELNMTQDELAKATGYTSRSSINKIELGLVDLPQTKISQIAKALKVSPTFLVGWNTTKNEQQDTFPIEDYIPVGNLDANLVVSIGRGGKRTIYNISDEDAAIVDNLLERLGKKKG